MAKIQTQTRLIIVKESIEEVRAKMDYQWLELTEEMSFYGEFTKKTHDNELPIIINREFIVAIY